MGDESKGAWLLHHACFRCEGYITEEYGLCGVCKAKDREWSAHAPIRRAVGEIEVLLKTEALIARGDENEERGQWRRETYKSAVAELSHLICHLEELEAEHTQL